MENYTKIIYNAIFHIPHFIMAIWIIISLYLISYKKLRKKVCITYQYRYLPFTFLYVGVLGAFWDIIIGYIEIDSITKELTIGFKNQIHALSNAVGLLISGISLFLGLKLFIDKGTGCPHNSWKK